MSSKAIDIYTHILNTEKYEWYYEIKSRIMIRLPSGTKIRIYSCSEDNRGRIVAVTEGDDCIYVEKDQILEVRYH